MSLLAFGFSKQVEKSPALKDSRPRKISKLEKVPKRPPSLPTLKLKPGPMIPLSELSPDVSNLAQYLTSESWKNVLGCEFSKSYFKKLASFLAKEFAATTVFPPKAMIFNSLNLCPVDKVKVVILGQDPYHDDHQAHGLCFSVLYPVKPPPSLRNIFKQLETEIPGFKRPPHGDLSEWASQGVLLLNTCLSVRAHTPLSHQQQGWEEFTDAVIATVSAKCENVVFLLWGSKSKKKAKLIDKTRHCILSSAHPSPLSAHRGFFGNNHFSKTNLYLKTHQREEINWNLRPTVKRPILLPPKLPESETGNIQVPINPSSKRKKT